MTINDHTDNDGDPNEDGNPIEDGNLTDPGFFHRQLPHIVPPRRVHPARTILDLDEVARHLAAQGTTHVAELNDQALCDWTCWCPDVDFDCWTHGPGLLAQVAGALHELLRDYDDLDLWMDGDPEPMPVKTVDLRLLDRLLLWTEAARENLPAGYPVLAYVPGVEPQEKVLRGLADRLQAAGRQPNPDGRLIAHDIARIGLVARDWLLDEFEARRAPLT